MSAFRNSLVATAFAVSVCLSSFAAHAQQKSLKEQMVGVWTLVSVVVTDSDGKKSPLVTGTDVKGLQFFTDSGRISMQVIGLHPKVAANDRLKMTPTETKNTAEGVFSFFGTYTVDEAEKTFTMSVERSTFPNQTEAPSKRLVTFSGDEMTVMNPARPGGGQVQFVWRKAK